MDEILNLIESVSEGFPSYFSGLKALLCTSTDNQKWIFNIKGQYSVKTESMLWFLFPIKM